MSSDVNPLSLAAIDHACAGGQLENATANPEFAVPQFRIKSANAADSVWKKLKQDDGDNSQARAKVMAMRDGTPPYDPAALRRARLGSMVNLNFGSGDSHLSKSEVAFYDLVNSVDKLLVLSVEAGEAQQRHEWSAIVAEELSRAIRGWEGFLMEYLSLVQGFVMHGVSVAYWEDSHQWTWRSTFLGELKVPRRARASESNLEVCAALRTVEAHDLYKWIADPAAAEANGVDVQAVRRAIVKANQNNGYGNVDDMWEKVQQDIRNGDLAVSSVSHEVNVVYMWVKEFDQSVTQLAFVEGQPELGFLMRQPKAYRKMPEALVMFTLGIGTNGTLHSIRGLGSKIFAQVQYENRLLSSMVGSAFLSSSLLLQPKDETALKNLQLTYSGGYSVVTPGVDFVERAYPNLQNSVSPALDRMSEMIRDRASQFSAASVFSSGSRRTRFEVAAEIEATGEISQVSQAFFYESWTRLLREVARRILRRDYPVGSPGSEERQEFINRCMRRGVPEEAIYAVDITSVMAVQAVGGGSSVRRLDIYERLLRTAGGTDEVGRANIYRDYHRELVGGSLVDRYSAPPSAPREPIDAQIARLENAALESGDEIQVSSGGMDAVHLDQHLPRLQMRMEQLEAGQLDLEAATRLMLPVYSHCAQHLEQMATDQFVADIQAAYRERLRIYGEIIHNGVKHIEALEKKAAQEQAAAQDQQPQQGQSQDPAASNKLALMIAEANLKLDFLKQKQKMELDFELQKAAMRRQEEDTKQATNLFAMLRP